MHYRKQPYKWFETICIVVLLGFVLSACTVEINPIEPQPIVRQPEERPSVEELRQAQGVVETTARNFETDIRTGMTRAAAVMGVKTLSEHTNVAARNGIFVANTIVDPGNDRPLQEQDFETLMYVSGCAALADGFYTTRTNPDADYPSLQFVNVEGKAVAEYPVQTELMMVDPSEVEAGDVAFLETNIVQSELDMARSGILVHEIWCIGNVWYWKWVIIT